MGTLRRLKPALPHEAIQSIRSFLEPGLYPGAVLRAISGEPRATSLLDGYWIQL
jgi:hypothetical protein